MARSSSSRVLRALSAQRHCPGSMFDRVLPPSPRPALELVNAALLEADCRLLHRVPDRARDQDLAGTRFVGNARTDVKRETEHLGPAHLVFARMQPHPDLQPQRAHRLADCGGATDPGSRVPERCEQSVSCRHYFLAAHGLQLLADGGVIVVHYLRPAHIAEPRGFLGGSDDIDEQDGGERLSELGVRAGGSAPVRDRSCQRFIAMVASLRDGSLRIVIGTLHRAASNCFLLEALPGDLSPVTGANNLDSAPLQENRRTNPPNAPRL